MPLAHLASRLYGTPLLIARAKLEVILSVLGPRIGLAASPLLPPVPDARPMAPSASGIAVIPVHGTLVRRTMGLDAASGLQSYDEIAARLQAALDDPQVQGILLDVDSSGGEAAGVFDLAEQIRAADRLKPVWAIADEAAFSAAYAIACAASRLLLTRTAGVGSIGVIALHVDQSARDAQDGLHYTAIYAGSRKNDYSPHAPLSPDALASLQSEVDRLYSLFVAHVAGMRGLAEDAVRGTEAALYFGSQAVDAGLADGIATRAQALADLAAFVRTAQAAPSRPAAPPAAVPAASSTTPILDPMENIMSDAIPVATPPVAPDPPTPHAAASVPDAQAIAELCLLAGVPERTAECLAARMTEAQVRRLLLDARANRPDIASRITPDCGTQASPHDSPVVAAVKKLIRKE